jgi:hypothetical protein
MKNRPLVCLVIPFLLAACIDERPDPEPEYPVAANATEAWPTQPLHAPVISREGILLACATAGSCYPGAFEVTPYERTALIDLCVSDAAFSAERAIPMSGWGAHDNERVEFWVDCVLDANDCSTVDACRTKRNEHISCEENGCHTWVDFEVSCNGSIATLTGEGQKFTRDCSRALAECDPQSPTGCTDRHYSKCPDDIDTHDRCDGNVRLGCDAQGDVSFHDCARMGGTCGLSENGTQDCLYPGGISLECQASEPASCDNGTLSACVNGNRVAIETSFCAE